METYTSGKKCSQFGESSQDIFAARFHSWILHMKSVNSYALRMDRLLNKSMTGSVICLLIFYFASSILDITEAVKTNVLSRKWRYIWVSVPCLKYDFRSFWKERFQNYSYHECLSKFWQLVKQDLIIRGTFPTYKLQFLCECYGEEQFKLLLSFCAVRHVEELVLLAGYEFNHCSCCTDPGQPIRQNFSGLVNLQLSLRDLGNLKTIQLVCVQFPKPDITDKLFSDCGILENLSLEFCCFGKVNALNISAHKLKNFIFLNEDHYRCGNQCEFEFELKVDTPSLVYFCYIGPRIQPFEFSSVMPFLNHAVIQFSLGVYETNLNPKLGTMVTHVHGVKELTLSKVFVLYFSLGIGRPFCKFNYLRSLKLEIGCYGDYNEGLINILKLTPNLENLYLLLTMAYYWGPRKIWKCRKEDIPCLSNRLQTIEISDFHDQSYPLELVKFFLQNGNCLENMKIMQKNQSPMNPMLLYVLPTIPLASEVVSVDVFTYSDTGRTQLYQFIYEKCGASARNRTKHLILKPSRRSPRIAALRSRSSS